MLNSKSNGIAIVVDLRLHFTPDPTIGWSQMHHLYSEETPRPSEYGQLSGDDQWHHVMSLQKCKFHPFPGVTWRAPGHCVDNKNELKDSCVGSKSDLFLSVGLLIDESEFINSNVFLSILIFMAVGLLYKASMTLLLFNTM